MGADVIITDNSDQVKTLLVNACNAAAEVIGGMAESYVKGLIAHPRDLAPELRNSYTHQVENGVLTVGSNLEVAPYVELGTGKFYNPPPEWLENHAKPKHGYGQAGIDSWIYYDPLEQVFKVGTPQEARPHLRPAMTEHTEEYKRVVEDQLKNA